ncbi:MULTISPECIES: hypothetical protein [Citrobacter]|uniref:hypothetical protein n=1 Tax=Citrobacter TaxID=544 RepID=UPI001BCEEF01|nr:MULTISPECIES: hypothetical protein [Citrobacter]EJG5461194.1 hypothetical protein [Salmonella enterica]ELS1936134.1 hypothetical protein [Salmonella enterica]MDM3083208.1 hypothetical protein [Citrobacter sp. Cf141]CAF2414368.1 hypothetical protein AI2826V1_5069 [Citrobacter freundii]CAH5299344.1 hypothetical protein AI2826V1_5069 [Citrobacter freundii]
MSTVEKILDSIGLKANELNSLDQTDSLIVCRIFEAVQQYAMYRDKNPALESECEEIQTIIRKHLNQSVIR